MPEDRDKTVGELFQEISELAEKVKIRIGYDRLGEIRLVRISLPGGKTRFKCETVFEHGERIGSEYGFGSTVEEAANRIKTVLLRILQDGTDWGTTGHTNV